MVDCELNVNGFCLVAGRLAGIDAVIPSEGACRACLESESPKGLNKATASIALGALPRPIPADKKFLLQEVRIQIEGPEEGVGKEMAGLVQWFVWADCDVCRYRVTKMNQWGPDGCRQHMKVIVNWLRQSAFKAGVSFDADYAAKAVEHAITLANG